MKIILFGSYAMVYTETKNTMKRRRTPGIALMESNKDVEQLFMLMDTRKYIHSNDWVEFLIGDEVVKRIEEPENIENNPHYITI